MNKFEGGQTPGEPRRELRELVGKMKLRKPHDTAQFKQGREIMPGELVALNECGLFRAVTAFLDAEQQRDFAYRERHNAGPVTLGLSSQQLYVPPELLLPDMDPEEPFNFTVMDMGYQSATDMDSNQWGQWKILVNPTIKSESETKSIRPEGCRSFPYDQSGARISCIIERPDAVSVRTFASDNAGSTFAEETVALTGPLAQLFSHEYEHLGGGSFGDGPKVLRRFIVPETRGPEYGQAIDQAGKAGTDALLAMQWEPTLSQAGYDAYMREIRAGKPARLLDYVSG